MDQNFVMIVQILTPGHPQLVHSPCWTSAPLSTPASVEWSRPPLMMLTGSIPRAVWAQRITHSWENAEVRVEYCLFWNPNYWVFSVPTAWKKLAKWKFVLFCLTFQMLGTPCTSVPWLGSLMSPPCWNPEPSTPRGSLSVCSSSTRWLEVPKTGWWSGSRWMMAQAPFVEWRKYTPSMVDLLSGHVYGGHILQLPLSLNALHLGKYSSKHLCSCSVKLYSNQIIFKTS